MDTKDLVVVLSQSKGGVYQLLERVVPHRLPGTDHREGRVGLNEWFLGVSVIRAMNVHFPSLDFLGVYLKGDLPLAGEFG